MIRLSIKAFGALMFWTAFGFAAVAAPVPGAPAPAFSGVTSKGETVSLADFRGRPVVLEWTNHDCPFVRKHYGSGTMQRLQRDLTEAGAVWISIISSAPGLQGHVTPAEAEELTARRGAYATHVILDESGDIGRLYDARTTPQMFLIDEVGTLRYMGAIDDKPSASPASLEGARAYVREAWAAYRAGQVPDPQSTKPYGCSVKYGH